MNCIICGLHENTHIGKAKSCFQGYGTVFKPETEPTVRPPFSNGPSYDLAASEKMYKDYKPHALCTVSAGFLQFLFNRIKKQEELIAAHARFHRHAGCPGRPECYVCAEEEWQNDNG